MSDEWEVDTENNFRIIAKHCSGGENYEYRTVMNTPCISEVGDSLACVLMTCQMVRMDQALAHAIVFLEDLGEFNNVPSDVAAAIRVMVSGAKSVISAWENSDRRLEEESIEYEF